MHGYIEKKKDVISIDESNLKMDLVYQRNTTFDEIAHQLSPSPPHNIVKEFSNKQIVLNTTTQASQIQTLPNNASHNHNYHNNFSNVTVTQHTDHVLSQIANNVINIAHLVDQVFASRGPLKLMYNFIHAPKGQSVINLPPKDLRHRFNALHHKPTSEQPGFILISASSILGFNHLDKLNNVREIFQALPGFKDLNWMYHDHHAAVIVEYVNPNYS